MNSLAVIVVITARFDLSMLTPLSVDCNYLRIMNYEINKESCRNSLINKFYIETFGDYIVNYRYQIFNGKLVP